MFKDDGTSYIHSRHLQNCVEEIFHHLGGLVYLLDLLLLHYTALTVVSSRPASSLIVDKHSLGQKPLCSSYFNISQTSFI